MKLYDLSLEQNKLVSAIINDLTKGYKTHSYTKTYERWANEGIQKVRAKAKARGLLLDDVDSASVPLVDIKAIIGK